MAYAPQTQYVWTPQGYVPASPQAAPAATQPLAGTPYYVWTPRGYMLVYPQAQPAAVQPAAKEVAAAPGEGTSPGGGGEQARPASAPAPESTQPPAAGAQAPPAAPPLAAGQAAPAPLVLPSPALPGPWRTGPRPKIGLRAGVVAPLGEQNASYAAAAQAGLFVSGMLPGDRLEYEAGLDFFSLEGMDVEAGGDVACARLDFVFARKGLSRAAEPYLAAGPRLYADRARTYWGTTSELAAGVSLAGGARRTGSGWDARLGLDILVGSENIRGFLSLLAGAKF